MKWHREPDGRILISLTRGDDLRSCVEGLAAELGLVSARLTAIGALEDPVIGWWDVPNRIYHKRTFEGIWELLTLDGNLSLVEGRPFMHVHVAISGHDYEVKGGHFFESRVGVVVEMFLDPYPTALPRLYCEDIGLPRWEPGG